jgi:hypothetical protein
MPEISVVMLAARWSEREIVPGVDELTTFDQNLERTINALERHGKKIIVLGQVPRLSRSLMNCMTKQVWFARKIPNCETVSLSDLSSYETSIWASMRILSRKHDMASFFAPQDHLCDHAICRATDEEGRPLYRDDDHLNVHGAYYLEPHIDEAIARHLRASRRAQIVETKLP